MLWVWVPVKTLEPLFFIYPTFYNLFHGHRLWTVLSGRIPDRLVCHPVTSLCRFLLDPTPFYFLEDWSNGVANHPYLARAHLSILPFLSVCRPFVPHRLLFLSSITVFWIYSSGWSPDACLPARHSLVCYFYPERFSERNLQPGEIIISSLSVDWPFHTNIMLDLASGWLVYLFFFFR